MALFGTPNAFLGLDIGTSSLKLVELVRRRRGSELTTYAQANLPNILIHPLGSEEDAIRRVANTVSRMMDAARISTDVVIAALPSSVVFSTVLTLPKVSTEELDKAVHIAARDVVPSDLDDMVLGWSHVGERPHMDTDQTPNSSKKPAAQSAPQRRSSMLNADSVPVFVTAAPKDMVNRYTRLMEMLKLQLHALEVETFPLVRSLFTAVDASGLIADIGDQTTTFHIIDAGTPLVSHSVEYGGASITAKVSDMLGVSAEEAEEKKVRFGLGTQAPEDVKTAVRAGLEELMQKGKTLLELYQSRQGRTVARTVLIGGGANLTGLSEAWSATFGHPAVVGNPWKGLAYPQQLDSRLHVLGPTYAVAVGLAMRGLADIE